MCGRIRAKGQSRNLLRVTLLAAAGVLLTCGSAGATSLSYTFDSDNQGWQQSQEGNSYSPAGFQPTGGNPGGRLTAVDTGRETGCPGLTDCNLLYFASPTKLPHLDYGSVASFDLRSSVSPSFAAELLLFPNGPNYLDGLIAETGGTTYHHLSITLAESSNWSVCPYAGGTCTAATKKSGFRGLIASSDQIAVMADVGPNGTGERYDLDNVTLTDGPTPAAPPPHPVPQPTKKKNKKKKPQQQQKKCKNKKRKHHATPAKKCKQGRAAGALLRG